MTELADQIDAARAQLARLERQAITATCSEMGHDWHQLGGRNCGCHDDACCSVPVYHCRRCDDCDYGENAEADEILRLCDQKVPLATDLELRELFSLEADEPLKDSIETHSGQWDREGDRWRYCERDDLSVPVVTIAPAVSNGQRTEGE